MWSWCASSACTSNELAAAIDDDDSDWCRAFRSDCVVVDVDAVAKLYRSNDAGVVFRSVSPSSFEHLKKIQTVTIQVERKLFDCVTGVVVDSPQSRETERRSRLAAVCNNQQRSR